MHADAAHAHSISGLFELINGDFSAYFKQMLKMNLML